MLMVNNLFPYNFSPIFWLKYEKFTLLYKTSSKYSLNGNSLNLFSLVLSARFLGFDPELIKINI